MKTHSRSRYGSLPLLAAAVSAVLSTNAAMAQSALEEIVVTARYREENLQQTPLAITAMSADTLTERGVSDVEDVGAMIPNAYFRPNGGTPIVGLRGKINSETLSFSKPTVAVYTDGVYWARQAGMNFTLFDLERVEVLRGPQGTLFGKNALGGAVNLISKAPQGDNTGYVEASYGNYNSVEIKGALDIALREDVFLRVTAMSEERDGYIDVLDFACQMFLEGTPQLAGYGDGIVGMQLTGTSNAYLTAGGRVVNQYTPILGVVGSAADNAFAFPMQVDNNKLSRKGNCKTGTQRGKDVQGVRAALRWQPTDKLDVTFTADIVDDNSEAWGNVTRKRASNLNANQRDYLNNYVMLDAGIGADKILAGAFFRQPDSFQTFENWTDPITGETIDQGEKIENKGYSLKVAYNLTDTMTLHYLGAMRELNTSLTASAGFPGTGDPYDIHNQVIWQHHEQIQNEIRLEGVAFDSKLDWTLGAFFFETDEWEMLKTDIDQQEWAGTFQIYHDDEFANSNQSFFAHGVYSLTDSFALTAGIRYTDESDDILFSHPPALVNIPLISFSSQRWDWKVGADWKLNDEMLVYGTVATGFRSAGFQARPFTPGQVNDVYGPFPAEEVLSYELGYKADFFNGRLRTNIAAFFDDYDPRVVGEGGRGQCTTFNDRSVPFPYRVGPTGGPNGTAGLVDTNGDGVGDLCPPGTPLAGVAQLGYTFNITTPAEVKGLELELQGRPYGEMLVSLTFGYNEFTSKIKNPAQAGYIHPDVIIQPKYNISGGMQYDFIRESGAVITPRLDWSYQGERTVGSLSNRPQADQFVPSYSLFNGRITYVSADKAWQTSVGATNLFNKFYYYNFESGNDWGVMASPGAPRMYELSVRRSF
jgi:iron complex outermembrane receptor protein